MGSLWRDVTYGLRVLARNPGFTAAAMVSLALGIGANTAIFTLVNSVLLRPWPVTEPDRLVNVHTDRKGFPFGRNSYPDYQDIRARCDAFAGIVARSYWPVSIKGEGKPKVVLGNLVSADYFDVLGVKPFLGRTFLAEEGAAEGSSPVVVLSHYVWTRDFGSDQEIVGKKVLVNSNPFTVVGVAPEGFRGLMSGFATDVWAPVTMARTILPVRISFPDRGAGWLDLVGRLKQGVSVEQAGSALATLAASLAREYPDTNREKSFSAVGGLVARFPIVDMGRGVSAVLMVLMVIVALVLVIACANLASLLLARATEREREIAMRLALGAGRGRVVRQLLTESVLLSVIAGLAGFLLARWLFDLLALMNPPTPVPISLDLAPDYRVFTFAAAVSVLTGVVFGLAPALRASGLRLFPALKDQRNGRRGGPRKARLQSCLVTAQVALSLVLLIGAGLCVKSLTSALTTDLGFETRNGLVVGLNLAYGQYSEQEGRLFYQRLLDRVESIPGVRSAGVALLAPLSYSHSTSEISVEGYEPREGESLLIDMNAVTPGYFETLGIPILEGRAIEDSDRADSEPVAVINERLAQRFWPGASPVGRSMTAGGDRVRIVGVARNSKYFSLDEEPKAFYYRPLSQVYAAFSSLHVRTAGDPKAVLPAVLRELEALDPDLPAGDANTMQEHLGLSQYPSKITGVLVGGFGVLALVLAMVGVYGVMAYSVSQRTHEFGVRTALGAERSQLVRLAMRRGLAMTLAGTAVGLAGAAALTRYLETLLHGVDPLDPAIFAGVAAALLLVALLACYLPARWAARVDPVVALKYE